MSLGTESSTLPPGWIRTNLAHLGEIYCGQSPSVAEVNTEGNGVPYVTGPEQWNGHRIDRNKWTEHPRRIAPEGSIFITVKGAGIGKLFPGIHAAIGRDIYAFKASDGIDPDYVFYALRHTIDEVVLNGKGDIPGLSKSHILDHAIGLPGAREQRRIVEKIDQLFSEMDNGVENLQRARQQLQVYRQALLQHAFEGKLTARWRARNPEKVGSVDEILERFNHKRQQHYDDLLTEWREAITSWEDEGKRGRKPTKPTEPHPIRPLDGPTLARLKPLPHGWCWVRVADLCDVVRGGSPRPAGDPRYYDGSIPFLKVADLTRTTGAYVDSHSFTIKEEGLSKTRYVSPPTLMLSNSGATLGVPKICRIAATFNDGIAAFLGIPETDLLYHYYFWSSKTPELRGVNQGAAQPNLNTSLIGDVVMPVCSPEEMAAVVNELDRLLSTTEQLLGDTDRQLEGSVALRQSILRRAFCGRLVPQNPEEEPASALLERIQGERKASSNGRKERKTGT